jgi:hypothetical protein
MEKYKYYLYGVGLWFLFKWYTDGTLTGTDKFTGRKKKRKEKVVRPS